MKRRRTQFKTYNDVNNFFNLAYEVLKWKVHRALINGKLEPYLGFLHSIQFGKPSLVCDFQDLYRYLIDDCLIQYSQNLEKSDLIVKTESQSRKKKGKREYLNDEKTRKMLKALNEYLESYISIPRIKTGNNQTIETLINEEAYLFANYLRNEGQTWNPRITCLN